MNRDLKPWMPVVAWMGFIFFMSTDVGSASHTGRLIEPLLRWVRPDISLDAIGLVHLVVRKCGHLSEYAVLGVLVRRAILRSNRLPLAVWSWRAAGAAWLIATSYAVTDEFHQTFVATRTAAPGDVLIDSCGALAALCAVYLTHSLREPDELRRERSGTGGS